MIESIKSANYLNVYINIKDFKSFNYKHTHEKKIKSNREWWN